MATTLSDHRQLCSLRLTPFALAGLLAFNPLAGGQDKGTADRDRVTSVVDSQGTVHSPSLSVPVSSLSSPEAQKAFIRFGQLAHISPDTDITALRKIHEKFAIELNLRLQQRYPVTIEHKTIGNVATDVITPRTGVAPRNARRVLINLHGGGFMWGEGPGAENESIPIASVGKFKVITINYRLAPENRFPAASEDVAAVYKVLLETYRPDAIGIFGCSAGGVLTAESVAWFNKVGLPMPGAIGTFCGSAAPIGGDSIHLTSPLTGLPLRSYVPLSNAALADDALWMSSPYFSGADPNDPLVHPTKSLSLLAKFPPTLLIAGSRDFTLSSLFLTQRELTKVGVDAELHVWDGVLHAFLLDPDLPESREAYSVIVGFFDRHLATY